MITKSKGKFSDNAVLCGWCGTPVSSANTYKESVCINCYTLLIHAGLADTEIFSAHPEVLKSPILITKHLKFEPPKEKSPAAAPKKKRLRLPHRK